MQIQYKAMTNVYCISTAQAGMFAGLCLLGVRSRPARNLLLSPAAVSLAGLLHWAPPAARAARRQQSQGRGRARGLQEAFLGPGPGQPSTSWPAPPRQLQLASRGTLELPRPRPHQPRLMLTCFAHCQHSLVCPSADRPKPGPHCPHWCRCSICRWRWC